MSTASLIASGSASDEIAMYPDWDRYKDIALAVRSIRRNCGDAFVQPFLDEYGVLGSDSDKVEYYMLLDELW